MCLHNNRLLLLVKNYKISHLLSAEVSCLYGIKSMGELFKAIVLLCFLTDEILSSRFFREDTLYIHGLFEKSFLKVCVLE
jgi:hypothetical protein